DRRVGRELQRMEERHRPDAGPHPDLFRERCRLADHEIGAGKLIGRLPGQEGAVLADPCLGHAEPVGDDDLLEVLVIAELGDLVVAVAVGENADLHPLTFRAARWSAGRTRAVKRATEAPTPDGCCRTLRCASRLWAPSSAPLARRYGLRLHKTL